MGQKAFALTAGVLFLPTAFGHLLRVFLRLQFVVAGVEVPVWVSGVAVVVVGYLAHQGLRSGAPEV